MDNIEKASRFVEDKMHGEATGHDWWHAYRVWQLAKEIGKAEKADLEIVELAALTHDLIDEKFKDSMSSGEVSEYLLSIDTDKDKVSEVLHIIENMSFGKSYDKDITLSREGQVVQDADRLDAIGAIGIARCIAYGARKGRMIHDPNIAPIDYSSCEDYRGTNGTSINHFHEKLFKLKDMMNTETGRRIAKERHAFMEHYLENFLSEWEGKR